jgi:hypothetical protein
MAYEHLVVKWPSDIPMRCYCARVRLVAVLIFVSYIMSVTALERKLADAKQSGQLPKVVIPVHIAGPPCGMEHKHGLFLTFFKNLQCQSWYQ